MHHHELIAAPTYNLGAAADALLENFSHLDDQPIARLMPVVIVDRLQPIQIDEQDCQAGILRHCLVATAFESRYQSGHRMVEHSAVTQSRQGIGKAHGLE